MKDISVLSNMASEALYEYSMSAFNYIDEIQSKCFSNELFIFKQILVICQLSGESITLLIGNRKIWDAEIIFRTVLEGTIKSLYLSIGSEEEKKEKCKDFWDRLPDLDFLKRSGKAEVLLDLIKTDNNHGFKDIKDMILSDIDKERINNLYSNKQKNELRNKWDFNNILKTITESKVADFTAIVGLGWNYQNLSNLIHMDATAINVIMERNTRPEEDRLSSYYIHSLRTLSEILLFAKLRLNCVSLWDNQDISKNNKILHLHNEINNEYEKAINEVQQQRKNENNI